MPTYELNLLIRKLTRPELVATLKRSAEAILNRNGYIRSIENLGYRTLPFKMKAHDLVHKEGNYFIVKFDTPPPAIADLNEEFGRDVDIVKRNFYKVDEIPLEPCTLHGEILPPAYRTEVQKMVELSKKKPKHCYTHDFNYNSGLNYYPFQK